MTLTALLQRWREAADGDLGRRNALDDPRAIRPAWSESVDPFAMLLLLAILHPGAHESPTDALVAAMSFFPPMERVAGKQARARPGMNYNGPSMFHFSWLGLRVRQALAETDADAETRRRLSDAIRGVFPDPYAIG